MRKIGGSAAGFVGFDKAIKCLLDGFGEHGELRSAFLLLENDERLAEMQIAALDLFAKDVNLSVLAAEAEHGSSGNVGVMQISGDESAEIVRVLARPAATTLMKEKLDAVNIGENAGSRRSVAFFCGRSMLHATFTMRFN